MKQLQIEILKTLLYYDIWSFPLTARELYTFLPVNSLTFAEFQESLLKEVAGELVFEHEGYYFVKGKSSAIVERRKQRERHARRMWIIARISKHIIKQFPFVRGVFVSGDLSKNATHAQSDIDFFIITEPDRLWITRTLLILFKKVFLLNRKKYFCLNYFATTDNLLLDDRNIFLATEVAQLKPLANSAIFHRYLQTNDWIKQYFPNFDIHHLPLPKVDEHRSLLQRLFELPFALIPASRLDDYLMKKMETIWARRYPEFDEETRRRIFRCTKQESRAYVGNFEEKILALYNQRLKDFGVLS